LFLIGSFSWAADVEMTNLSLLGSYASTHRDGFYGVDLDTALDARFAAKNTRLNYSLVIDSDIRRSFKPVPKTTYDRLKLEFRTLPRKTSAWKPLLYISSEGDHSFEKQVILLSSGYRYSFSHGYIEVTAGLSRNIRTQDHWKADFGSQFSYQKSWGRLTAGVKPQLRFYSEARVAGGQWRYTFDWSVDYALRKNLAIGLSLQQSNVGDQRMGRRVLGIRYIWKAK